MEQCPCYNYVQKNQASCCGTGRYICLCNQYKYDTYDLYQIQYGKKFGGYFEGELELELCAPKPKPPRTPICRCAATQYSTSHLDEKPDTAEEQSKDSKKRKPSKGGNGKSPVKPSKAENSKTTVKPAKTPKPGETRKPEKTVNPEKTVEPEQTENPEETTKPEKTSKPNKTAKPEKTTKPNKAAGPDKATNGKSKEDSAANSKGPAKTSKWKQGPKSQSAKSAAAMAKVKRTSIPIAGSAYILKEPPHAPPPTRCASLVSCGPISCAPCRCTCAYCNAR